MITGNVVTFIAFDEPRIRKFRLKMMQHAQMSDGYIISISPKALLNTTSYTHLPVMIQQKRSYKNRAATAPTPATKPPTLTLEAAPVNSETGAL